MDVLVDGHNLMFAASRMDPRFAVERGEPAREELLAMLSRYQAARGDRILCFFDGGAGGQHLPRHTFGYGLQILYSDALSDADTEIKNHVSHHPSPRDVRVITSDNAIQDFVSGFGAAVAGSRTFLREVRELLAHEAPPDGEPVEKYEGADDAEADFWLGVFGEEEDD